MTSTPKTIQIFLPSGEPHGIRIAEITTRIVQVIEVRGRATAHRLVLAGKLRDGHALQALATANRLGLRRHPSRSLWPRAWELRTNLSATTP